MTTPGTITTMTILWVCVVLLSIPGCVGSRPIVADGERTTMREGARGDTTDTISPPDGITPNPLDARRERDNDPTLLAERLGRLDALIRRAPTDSARMLREEYNRLLEEYTGEARSAATGSQELDNPARRSFPDDESQASIDSFLARREGGRRDRSQPASPNVTRSRAAATQSGAPRSTVAIERNGTTTIVPSSDRTMRHQGNASRRSITRHRAAVAAESASESTSQRSSPRVRQEGAGRREQGPASTGADGNREFVEGLAQVSAGRYREATEHLPRAIGSGDLSRRNHTRAEHAYGESLEGTGREVEAVRQYGRAARGHSDLRHRSYIDRCRALARSGRRDDARQLLREFIRQNPKSGQVVAARRLLQTL